MCIDKNLFSEKLNNEENNEINYGNLNEKKLKEIMNECKKELNKRLSEKIKSLLNKVIEDLNELEKYYDEDFTINDITFEDFTTNVLEIKNSFEIILNNSLYIKDEIDDYKKYKENKRSGYFGKN